MSLQSCNERTRLRKPHTVSYVPKPQEPESLHCHVLRGHVVQLLPDRKDDELDVRTARKPQERSRRMSDGHLFCMTSVNTVRATSLNWLLSPSRYMNASRHKSAE